MATIHKSIPTGSSVKTLDQHLDLGIHLRTPTHMYTLLNHVQGILLIHRLNNVQVKVHVLV